MDIALALGGGGARGNAHIGVIKKLNYFGFKIKAISGTSAGGIVAAFYASGYSPEEIEDLFSKVDQSKLYSRSPDEGPGILGLVEVSKILDEIFGNKRLEELSIPCGITAVDINHAQEVTLTEGRVVDAILATIALPGIFPPKIRGDQLLVDGAVLDPIPVELARKLSGGLPTIAVVLTPRLNTTRNRSFQLPAPIPAPIYQRLLRTRLAQSFEIFLASVDVSGRMLTELKLKVDDPEVIIRPEVSNLGILDQVDIHQLVELGEEAVIKNISNLKKIAGWKGRFNKRLKEF